MRTLGDSPHTPHSTELARRGGSPPHSHYCLILKKILGHLLLEFTIPLFSPPKQVFVLGFGESAENKCMTLGSDESRKAHSGSEVAPGMLSLEPAANTLLVVRDISQGHRGTNEPQCACR